MHALCTCAALPEDSPVAPDVALHRLGMLKPCGIVRTAVSALLVVAVYRAAAVHGMQTHQAYTPGCHTQISR